MISRPTAFREGDVAAESADQTSAHSARTSDADRPRTDRPRGGRPRRRWWKKIGCSHGRCCPEDDQVGLFRPRYELVPPQPNTVARRRQRPCQVRCSCRCCAAQDHSGETSCAA